MIFEDTTQPRSKERESPRGQGGERVGICCDCTKSGEGMFE